jgi:pimeloyl-ACP methyl ester carboxylesterase
MHTESGFAEVNGTRLYYEVSGNSEWPLVLIHGYSFDTRIWDRQFEVFANAHRVLRFDLRGFGKSALPTTESYAHTEDINALFAHLDLDRAAILGHALGGRIALDFALEFPERVRALILLDAIVAGFSFSSEIVALHQQSLQLGKEVGIHAAKELWLSHPVFAAIRENPAAFLSVQQIVSDYSGWHWVNTDPLRVLDPPAIKRLEEIRVPTLIIVGERDMADMRTIAATLQQRLPNARKVLLTKIGHLPHLEDPSTLNEIVLRFLALPQV